MAVTRYRARRHEQDVERTHSDEPTTPQVAVLEAESEVSEAVEAAERFEEAVKASPLVQQERIHEADVDLMNRACARMLDYVPNDCAELVAEYVESSGTPVWQVIAGYMLRSREMGTLFSPVVLPEWTAMVSPKGVRPCEFCGAGMHAKTWGQTRCCNNCVAGKVKELGHNDNCALD